MWGSQKFGVVFGITFGYNQFSFFQKEVWNKRDENNC